MSAVPRETTDPSLRGFMNFNIYYTDGFTETIRKEGVEDQAITRTGKYRFKATQHDLEAKLTDDEEGTALTALGHVTLQFESIRETGQAKDRGPTGLFQRVVYIKGDVIPYTRKETFKICFLAQPTLPGKSTLAPGLAPIIIKTSY
jgi:hypothetical protein